MMPGVAFEEIRDAIVDAYGEPDLEEALRILMNLRLDVITKPDPLGHRVFELVEWAEMHGRDAELVRTLARARPHDPAMQAIYKKYGMAIPISVACAGLAVEAGPVSASESGFQKLVKPQLEFAEFGVWLAKMTAVESQVCLITLADAAVGTGFLVGPDVVLTNWHVMESLLTGRRPPSDVKCVFDFKRLADGTKTATPVSLHPTAWNVDACPYATLEGESRPDEAQPTEDELDYAVVRLAEAVGEKPWAARSKPDAGAPLRGWVHLPEVPYPYLSPMGAMIAQHPAGWPLKLAIDTAAIEKSRGRWLNANGTRIRYAANTLPGSSGSPVFDLEWNVIALHHYGDPAYGHLPTYNQGIPIAEVRDRLRRNGKEGVLGVAAA